MTVRHIVVINDFSLAKGGATGLALLSVKHFVERGFKVTYFCGDTGENISLRALNVDVISLNSASISQGNKITSFFNGIYNFFAHEVLSNWVRENDEPTIVYHVHGWSKILSPSIFRALRRVCTRTFVHAHDFFLACPNGAFMNYVSYSECPLKPASLRCLATNCDKRNYLQKLWRTLRHFSLRLNFRKKLNWGGILMIHDEMRSYLCREGYASGQLLSVRNPAEPFSNHRIKAENNNLFFYVGRVESEKGVEDFLRAAEIAGINAAVIGDGPLLSKLESEYNNVRFYGWCSRSKISELIVNARALVMPSRYPEPFGLVAAEASMSGLPLIMSSSALLAVDVIEAKLGTTCVCKNVEEFTDALLDLNSKPYTEIRDISERAYNTKFFLANCVDGWIDTQLNIYECSLRDSKRMP